MSQFQGCRKINRISLEELFLRGKRDNGPHYKRKFQHYRHIGPYNKIPQAFASVSEEMKEAGVKTCLPYLEIYGHWMPDETKLETEMLWCLK